MCLSLCCYGMISGFHAQKKSIIGALMQETRNVPKTWMGAFSCVFMIHAIREMILHLSLGPGVVHSDIECWLLPGLVFIDNIQYDDPAESMQSPLAW